MGEAISWRQIAGTFLAHPSLTPRERARLIEAGLPASSLEHPIPILAGWIVGVGPTSFEFDQHLAGEPGTRALLFLVTERDGTALDIAAWDLETGQLSTWLDRAFALGQDQLYLPRLSEHEALVVWRSPLDWLRQGRRGIVLLRPHAAAYALDDAGPLMAEDVEHGLELRKLLTRPGPRILVRRSDRRAA